MTTQVPTLRQVGREWLVALLSFSLLVAPFGCQLQIGDGGLGGGGGQDDGLTKNSTGLFLNSDKSSPIVLAGRSANGDGFFVFGQRTVAGGLGQVESVVVRFADGTEAFITFTPVMVGTGEQYLPTHLQGPDGSYLHIYYDEVSAQRLTVRVEIYNASNATTETVGTDIDLVQLQADINAALQQAAAAIEDFAKQHLVVPELEEAATAKMQNRAQGILVGVLVAVPLTLLAHFMVIIVGDVMKAVLDEIAAEVMDSVSDAMDSAFRPLFTFSAVLGDSGYRIELGSLFDVFIDLPPPPIITIEI